MTNVDEPIRPQPVGPAPEATSITERLTDARSILGVLGFLLFVVLRIAYSRFYGELGLSPDDLGLGYIDLLVQSAVGAVALLVVYTVVAALVVPLFVGSAYRTFTDARNLYPLYFLAVPGFIRVPIVTSLATAWFLREVERGKTERLAKLFGVSPEQVASGGEALQLQEERRRSRRRAHFSGLGLLAALAGVAALLAAFGAYDWETFLGLVVIGAAIYILVGFLVGVIEGVIVGTRWIGRGLGGQVELAGQSARPWFRSGVALVMAIVVAGTAVTLLVEASRDARAVRDGHAARFEMLGVRVTSWGADEARLSWTTDKIDAALKPLSKQCLLYLGQANQTIFVRSEGGASFRIPAGVASVRIAAC